MTRAVRNESGHPHEEKTSKLGMSITSLFHFHDDGKTNKSKVTLTPTSVLHDPASAGATENAEGRGRNGS